MEQLETGCVANVPPDEKKLLPELQAILDRFSKHGSEETLEQELEEYCDNRIKHVKGCLDAGLPVDGRHPSK